MSSHQIIELERRGRFRPESVALFSDTELINFATESNDTQLKCYAAGEMLVRLYLYSNEQPIGMKETVASVAGGIGASPLVDAFMHHFLPAQGNDRVLGTPDVFGMVKTSTKEQSLLWSFTGQRMRAFQMCEGIIPLAVGGDAIAIPFRIKRDRVHGQFIDIDEQTIPAWALEAKSLWTTVGRPYGVDLECAFGKWAVEISGGSFSLPVLLALANHPEQRIRPLDVICSGEISQEKLKELDEKGKEGKAKLASRMGARFFADGYGRGLVAGMDATVALEYILKELGWNSNEIHKCVQRVFLEKEDKPFSVAIASLTHNFVGRSDQLTEVFRKIDSRSKDVSGSRIYIHGLAGSGKSAFVAELQKRAELRHGWKVISYFFDPQWTEQKPKTLNDFYEHAAVQLAAQYDLPVDDLRGLDRDKRLSETLKRVNPEEAAKLLFCVDGLDDIADVEDAHGSLDSLVQIASEPSRCHWVFATQESLATGRLLDIPDLFPFPLGGLNGKAMREMIETASPGLEEPLVSAIIERAEGSPQYTKFALIDCRASGGVLSAETLPPGGLPGYYQRIIKRIRDKADSRERWTGHLWDILALFAKTHQRVALTAASIGAMLERSYRVTLSQDEVDAALQACKPLLRLIEVDEPAQPTLWSISQNGCRLSILQEKAGRMPQKLEAAGAAWSAVCRELSGAFLTEASTAQGISEPSNLEPGLRKYALRFVLRELSDGDGRQTIIDLARTSRFLDAQARELGPRFALETMTKAIECALAIHEFVGEPNLAAAASITLERAKRTTASYSQSPKDAIKAGHYEWAMELIERIENQKDRTLWFLSLAVRQVYDRRPWLAGRVLDSAIPPVAVHEKLIGGASMSAAVLISLLTEVSTRRFQWHRFVTCLDDPSKREVILLLIRNQRLPLEMVWAVLWSIEDPGWRDDARQDVVRELADRDIRLAEKQLGFFSDDRERASAAVEIVVAYARRKQWDVADKVITRFIPRQFVWQHAGALAHIAASLSRANRGDIADETFQNSLNGIRRSLQEIRVPSHVAYGRDADRYVECAKAYAQFGLAEIEAGFLDNAVESFRKAAEISLDLKRASHIARAIYYTALIGPLSEAATYSPQIYAGLKRIVSELEMELDASDDGKVDATRSRIVSDLGRWGHFELAVNVLERIQSDTVKAEAAGRITAYLHRTKQKHKATDQKNGRSSIGGLRRLVSDPDAKMMYHGLVALENARTTPHEALGQVWGSLRVIGGNSAGCWGPARILSEAGVVLAARDNDAHAASAFDLAKQRLRSEKRKYVGRYLVDIANRLAEAGRSDEARAVLGEAKQIVRENYPKDKVESNWVILRAEIESAEIRWKLAERSVVEADSVFKYVDGLSNQKKDIVKKLELFCALISPFAEAGRVQELEHGCDFALTRLDNFKYGILPEKRSELAGEFAGKLGKSALNLDGFSEWAERFASVCEEIGKKNGVAIPGGAIRARALLLVEHGDFSGAVAAAHKIGVGETRSVVFRNLAIRAVHEGRSGQALQLSIRITHGRSQHLADIGREIARRPNSSDPLAEESLHRFVVLCSEYPDAAHRIVSSLIRFHEPESDELISILQDCGVWEESKSMQYQ